MGNIAVDENGNIIDTNTGQVLIQSKEKPEEVKSSNQPVFTSPPKVYTKYEVKPESNFIINFGLMEYQGRIIVVEESDFNDAVEKHWVKFRMWTYSEELDMKSKATEFDNNKRVHLLNNDKLNELKLRNLILDWSFSENNLSLKLLHVNNYLSDEGLKIFYSLYPTIVRHIINKMNEVLEFNG